ncbi:hypothetical protein BpHYR1_010956 [Brachionus plicatilis]|uniref:Uncharacterized protein n=1 Tax=Brachionus plicatilis TaxID=10195 RepID=A0A3M7SP89_BRAPC|nr:hypothetical protein BpHYR1_010956 [Brachionus plicatilis]
MIVGPNINVANFQSVAADGNRSKIRESLVSQDSSLKIQQWPDVEPKTDLLTVLTLLNLPIKDGPNGKVILGRI